MTTTARTMTTAGIAVLLAASVLNAAETVKLEPADDSLTVSIDGKEFAVFHFAADQPKPYFWPVRAPEGAIITRPLENPADHPHHKGVWISIDEVNELKFWAEKAKIKNVSVKPLEKEGSPASFEVVNHWLGEDEKPVVIEKTVVSVHPNRLVEFDILFTAGEKEVTFADTKEGLFGIRVVDSMREKEGGKVVNADGKQGTKEAWGQTSRWVDYYGEVDGKTVGVAIFDHPYNFRPSRYHVRDYGLFSISPFGEKSYTNGKFPENPLVLEPGKSVRLRYALYVHAGDTNAANVNQVYEGYLKSTK